LSKGGRPLKTQEKKTGSKRNPVSLQSAGVDKKLADRARKLGQLMIAAGKAGALKRGRKKIGSNPDPIKSLRAGETARWLKETSTKGSG
jgi:hypothetical protein